MTKAVLDDHLLRDLLADDPSEDLTRVLADHDAATTDTFRLRCAYGKVMMAQPGIRAAAAALDTSYRTILR